MFASRGRWSAVALGVAMLAVVAGAAGCGDDGGGEKALKLSAANELPKTFVERMAKLLATTTAAEDCAQLDALSGRSYYRFSCPPAKSLRRSMADLQVVGAEEYDTGAIVDYKSGRLRAGGTIVLFVGPDRNWGVSRFGILTKPSTGTGDAESRDGYRNTVKRWLDAVRRRDCDVYAEVAFTGDQSKQEVCNETFAKTKDLNARMDVDPDAELRYLGGNDTYGFFGFETKKPTPQNLTISVVKSSNRKGDDSVVLDAAPSPTAADRRSLNKRFRQLQEQKRDGSMEPSSKPSDPSVTTP